jgi:hypothetical protein
LYVLQIGISFAQAPSFLWAKSAGSSDSYDKAFSVTTDANKNIYVAGYFNSSSIIFGDSTFTNSGGWDPFLVKYNPAGKILWARRASGSSVDFTNSIAADARGNIIAAGEFRSPSISFGERKLNNVDNSENTHDIFIVKYDTSSHLIWARSFGGTHTDEAIAVAVDGSGNIYVAGTFLSLSLQFGATVLTNSQGENTPDIFVVKLDSSGNVVWAKQQTSGGASNETGYSIAVDAGGNVIVVGSTSSSTITFGTTTLTNAGLFLVKYDVSGNVLWAKGAGEGAAAQAKSVAVDNSGNIVIAGSFGSASIVFGSTTLISSGGYDLFVAKYDANGNVLWAKGAVGGFGYNDEANAVATDASGNVVVAGWFESGNLTFGSTTLSKIGACGLFIAKYDASGNALWAKSASGAYYDYAQSVATDVSGAVVVAGYFRSPTIDFGSTTLTNTNTTGNIYDLFVAKLGTTTGVEETENSVTTTYSLNQNYPNPFNPATTISFTSPYRAFVTLKIYDALGREVAILLEGEVPAGSYTRQWNAAGMPGGIYFYRLLSRSVAGEFNGAFSETKKLIMLK